MYTLILPVLVGLKIILVIMQNPKVDLESGNYDVLPSNIPV